MRVLVLGGSGWLGAAAVALFRERFAVHAPGSREVDVADEAAVRRAIDGARAGGVVNLAAVNPGAGDARAMDRVNRVGAGAVARACAASGVRLVHMSSDVVLDGRSPPYRDDAPANPVNTYGRSKAAGEAEVRAACPGALLLRTSLVFDPGVPDRFTRSVLERMSRGEPSALFTDEIRCPVSRGTLVLVLAELVGRPDLADVAGFLNVSGTQALSRHDFAMRLLRRFGATRFDLVRTALAADAAEPRPIDLTLDVSRARSILATPLRSVDEELAAAISR